MKVPDKNQKHLQRYAHSSAAVHSVHSDSMEVIIFGGRYNDGSLTADTVVIKFG